WPESSASYSRWRRVDQRVSASIKSFQRGRGFLISRNFRTTSAQWHQHLAFLKRKLVGPSRLVRNLYLYPRHSRTGMFVAKALMYAPSKAGQIKPLICTGIGSTRTEAMTKAIIEAVERTAMDDLRIDRFAAATQLDKRWLDPRKVTPITK